MEAVSIITPTSSFPDQEVSDALASIGLICVSDTTGRNAVIHEWRYLTADGRTELRYMLEPELEIPWQAGVLVSFLQ